MPNIHNELCLVLKAVYVWVVTIAVCMYGLWAYSLLLASSLPPCLVGLVTRMTADQMALDSIPR